MTRDDARWRIGLAGTLSLTALGLLYAEPRLFAAAVVPLGYVAFGALSKLGETDLVVERNLDPARPGPGERVTVTLRVENVGESALTDARLVDGVPDELAVVAGSPRACVALQPGAETTVTYDVVAKRGDHDFDDPVVRFRTLSGTASRTAEIPVAGDQTLTCARAVTETPFRSAATRRAGTMTTDSGGSGVEFHSTREYVPGDPMARINWRRLAKTGDLTTVQFREERATRTVLVVDARPATRITARPGYPNGAALCAYAAERLHDALTDATVATAVTALGVAPADFEIDAETLEGFAADGLPWAASDATAGSAVSPAVVFAAARRAADRDDPDDVPVESSVPTADADGDSKAHSGRTDSPPTEERPAAADGGEREQGEREHRRTPSAGSERADGGTSRTDRLLARLPSDSRVVLVSPMLDDWPVSFARSLAARDHELLVLSPDVTGGSPDGGDAKSSGVRSPGRAVAGAHRDLRLRDAELSGATAVDWDLDDPLGIALKRSLTTLLSTR